MVNVTLNTTGLLIKLSQETITHLGHHAAERTEHVRLQMLEFNRINFAILRHFFTFISIFIVLLTRLNKTATKPETIIDDGQNLIHTLNIAESCI